MPQPQLAQTPTPESSASSSGQVPSVSPATSQASPWQLIGHAISGSVAAVTGVALARWFPACLDLVKLPTGGVSHDLWAWLPLAFDVAGIAFVASPVSFLNLVQVLKGVVKLPGR
jgi:hypothetical protein